jgi:quercetin dioxygenase-like cupin family protein
MTIKVIRNIKPEFVDERGEITKILDDGRSVIKSIILITSKKGAIRANHYHKQDSHFAYMLTGSMEYTEKPVEGGKKESIIVKAGDMVYSAPMVIHAMRFLEDSSFLTLATEWRKQEAYEEDLVRVKLI